VKGQSVLITGGAGFIGSHVVERLVAMGANVRVLDNLSTGHRSNLDSVADQIEWIEADARDQRVLRDAILGVSAVVHLAAIPSVPQSIAAPADTHSVNYGATMAVLEAMRQADVSRILYASSAAVYSPTNPAPHAETDFPDPSSPYGVDKLSSEFLLKAYARLHGIRPTALRFFNVYGERQDPQSAYSGVISIFASRISAGESITVHGDGTQSRDFVYVQDLARILVDLVDHDDLPPIINVGKGRSETLKDLITALEHATGRTADVTYGVPRAGDIPHSQADDHHLRALGYTDWTPLETGLRRLLDFLANR
jgi:UDP-glucose 4-epimerase